MFAHRFIPSHSNSHLVCRLHADYNKFLFQRMWSMSVEEMATAIFRVSKSKSKLMKSKPKPGPGPELPERVLTQPECEYLARTFGSIRTAHSFFVSDGLELTFARCLN
jgi:hypothetical protein